MKKVFAVFVFLCVASAQQFKQDPLLTPTYFYCDGEDSFIVDRKNNCVALFSYKPDPNIGLDKIIAEVRHDYVNTDTNRPSSEYGGEITWSKIDGNLEPAYGNTDGISTLEIRFSHQINTTEYRSGGLFNLNSYIWTKPYRFYQLRLKANFYFSNGIQYRKETRIRIR